MTNNNEASRPRRNYDNANNERHSSGNRNYSNERRTQYGNNYHSNQSGERPYRSYNNDAQPDNSEGGVRKRRPRVGDRVQQGGGGSYGNRSQQSGGYGNRSQGGGGYGNRPQHSSGGYGNRSQQGGDHDNRNRMQQSDNQPKKVLKKKKLFKQIKYKENADPTAPIRLNKYLANAGVCSRREADEFIQAGFIKVNGEVITELGTKITRADEVMFHDQPVKLESKVYVLLNKPKGFVTTTDDPENRKTVMDLVKSACQERIYPVGRLDRATTGVLLLTNDGDLASKLTHPKYEKRKIYQVWLDKPVAMEHMQAIADGIELEDGEIHADAISYVTEEDLSQVGIEIHSGKNRVVRRMFEKLGYRVVKLDRVYFAGLTKKNLSRGKWRYLTEQEVNMLRMGAFD